MNEYLKVLSDNLIVVISICCVIFLIIVYYVTAISSYQNNYLEVLVNNEPVRFYYEQEYHNGLIQSSGLNGWGGHNDNYEVINNYNLNNNFTLNVNEYVVYNTNKEIVKNVPYNNMSNNYTYELVNDSKISLKIMSPDTILYEGDYISDISKYITSKGRYYFNIEIKSRRTPKLLASVKTKITFNILVGETDES